MRGWCILLDHLLYHGDRSERMRGATVSVLLQNGFILASASAAGALMLLTGGGGDDGVGGGGGGGGVGVVGGVGGASIPSRRRPHAALFWPLTSLVVAAGAASSVGSTGATAAVEREWVQAICGGDAMLVARANSGASFLLVRALCVFVDSDCAAAWGWLCVMHPLKPPLSLPFTTTTTTTKQQIRKQ